MKELKLPNLQIFNILLLMMTIGGIKAFSSLNNDEVTPKQHEYKIKLNRNDLNFEKNIIQFQTSNKALRCSYEIMKLCTKLKKSDNIECSSNKLKFLPFYLISNRLSTKSNKINFDLVDRFSLIINGNCFLTNEAMSSNFDKMEIKNLNLNNGVNNKNEIKLNIDLISAPNDNFDDIEINLISASNNYEIMFDNQTSIYQLLINNTNYLSSNTILAYLILNIVDYEDYKLKFEIKQILGVNYDDLLELDFDEMKYGLYSIKLKNSFNSTKFQEIFNYDFIINLNDNLIIKKFQIKFNENTNQLRLMPVEIEEEEEEEEITITKEIFSNNDNLTEIFRLNKGHYNGTELYAHINRYLILQSKMFQF